jgi:hypothetical protein
VVSAPFLLRVTREREREMLLIANNRLIGPEGSCAGI